MPALASPAVAAIPEVAPVVERLMSEFTPGARARVARVLGDTADALRLKALGLCEGREIEVVRTGDAWILKVLGSRIGISSRLASTVYLVAA